MPKRTAAFLSGNVGTGRPEASIEGNLSHTPFGVGRRLTALAFLLLIQANMPEETLEISTICQIT